jgi:hypothetical protein
LSRRKLNNPIKLGNGVRKEEEKKLNNTFQGSMVGFD